METSAAPRYRKRLSCRLQVTGSVHTGMILNVSRSGMFVQTTASARPGDAAQLDLAVQDGTAISLETRVIWRRVVPPHLRAVSMGGMGLRIQRASGDYLGFVAALAAPARAESSDTATPQPAQPSFRVRLRLDGSPRTRVVTISAADEASARARARQQAGAQWAVMDVEAVERN